MISNKEKRKIFHYNGKHIDERDEALIIEAPLSINIQGNPYSVMMRTPGDELAQIAGLCFVEGIIDSVDDLLDVSLFPSDAPSSAEVTLTETRYSFIGHKLSQKGFIKQTSSAIVRTSNSDLCDMSRVSKSFSVDAEQVLSFMHKLNDYQPLRHGTHSSHAAALLDDSLKIVSIKEDVGRHHALDKAIGDALLQKKIGCCFICLLSSRVSFDMIQKVSRAQLPIVVSVSRPTELAVRLAAQFDISLACLSRDGGMYIFCHKERFIM